MQHYGVVTVRARSLKKIKWPFVPVCRLLCHDLCLLSGQTLDLPLNKLYFSFWAVCSRVLGNIFIVIDWWNLPQFTCLLGRLRQTVPLHELGLGWVQWPESTTTQNKCRLNMAAKEKKKIWESCYLVTAWLVLLKRPLQAHRGEPTWNHLLIRKCRE